MTFPNNDCLLKPASTSKIWIIFKFEIFTQLFMQNSVDYFVAELCAMSSNNNLSEIKLMAKWKNSCVDLIWVWNWWKDIRPMESQS